MLVQNPDRESKRATTVTRNFATLIDFQNFYTFKLVSKSIIKA